MLIENALPKPLKIRKVSRQRLNRLNFNANILNSSSTRVSRGQPVTIALPFVGASGHLGTNHA
jgi:hypothetical protein